GPSGSESREGRIAICSADGWFRALVRGGGERWAVCGVAGAGGFGAGGGDCGGLREAGEAGEFVRGEVFARRGAEGAAALPSPTGVIPALVAGTQSTYL